MELISIIITTFNVEKYIRKCLISVFKQNYKKLEIIVVDDCSSDTTYQICLEMRKHSLFPFKLFSTDKNRGVSVARNIGINEATGSYLMFIDGDDYIKHNMIGELSVYLENTPDIVSCGFSYTSSGKCMDYKFFDEEYSFYSDIEKIEIIKQLLNSKYGQPKSQEMITGYGVPWGKLIKTSIIKNNNLKFNEKLRRMQDNVFIMNLLPYCSNVIYINKFLYCYRTNHIMSYKNGYSYNIYVDVLNERKKFFENHAEYITEDVLTMFERNKKVFLYAALSNSIGRISEKKQILDEIEDIVNMPEFQSTINKKYHYHFDKIELVYCLILLSKKFDNYLLVYFVFRLINKIKSFKYKSFLYIN